MWSVGVITYILLTGCPPFQGENLAEVYNEILYEKLKLYRSDWEELSVHALEFVKNMLKKNPDARLTPNEALTHPFIEQKKVREMIKPGVLKKLTKSNENSYLKKEIFMILSTYVKSEVIEKWNRCFNSLDKEGTGKIKISEVISMLKDSNINESRIKKIELMYRDKVDTTISYSDFLAKVINIRREIREEDVQKAFEQLDVDKSGKIGTEDLTSLIQRRGHDHLKASTLMNEVDSKRMLMNGDFEASGTMTQDCYSKRNEISYGTFKDYILGDDGASEYSEYTGKSSYIYVAPNNQNYDDDYESRKGSIADQLGSILIQIDEKQHEEEKCD